MSGFRRLPRVLQHVSSHKSGSCVQANVVMFSGDEPMAGSRPQRTAAIPRVCLSQISMCRLLHPVQCFVIPTVLYISFKDSRQLSATLRYSIDLYIFIDRSKIQMGPFCFFVNKNKLDHLYSGLFRVINPTKHNIF